MRQVLTVAFAFMSLSLLSGCTLVDPEYNHQMGGFPIYSSVKTVKNVNGAVVEKPNQPVTVKS
jgi:hypothetical protein